MSTEADMTPHCGLCGDTGWRRFEQPNGYSYADHCVCRDINPVIRAKREYAARQLARRQPTPPTRRKVKHA